MPNLFHRSPKVALNFRDEGEGPALLFLHGVGSALIYWDEVITALGAGRRSLRFDLRGHGESVRTPGPYSLEDFFEDALAFLDDRGVERVVLVGFSLGGLIAQAIALAHPERISGMVLISTIAGRTREEQARVQERARILAKEGAGAHLNNAVERWFTDAFRNAHPEVLERRRQQSLKNDPACYASAYRVLADNDLGPQLSALTLPTLVMTGEKDIGSTPRMARIIHERIAGSELHIFPELKHAVLLEASDQVATYLDDFLGRRLGI